MPDPTFSQEQYDNRNNLTAYHEAGHAVVGWHRGAVDIEAVLYKASPENTQEPTTSRCRRFNTEMAARDLALMGIAGAVSGLLYQSPKVTPEEVLDAIVTWETELSESDWQAIGVGLGIPGIDSERLSRFTEQEHQRFVELIADCLAILRSNWHQVEAVAGVLNAKGVCGGWDLLEAMTSHPSDKN